MLGSWMLVSSSVKASGAAPAEVEGTGEERGHLLPGDETRGTELVDPTATRDAGRGDEVDVGLVDAALVVGEGIGCTATQVEGTGEERGHLLACDVALGAVRGGGTAAGDPLEVHPLDVGLEDRACDVGEGGEGGRNDNDPVVRTGRRGDEEVPAGPGHRSAKTTPGAIEQNLPGGQRGAGRIRAKPSDVGLLQGADQKIASPVAPCGAGHERAAGSGKRGIAGCPRGCVICARLTTTRGRERFVGARVAGPAVVSARSQKVHLVVLIRPVLHDIDLTRPRADRDALGIAMAHAVDGDLACRTRQDRVVEGDRAVALDPQDLAVEAVRVLGEGRRARITHAYPEPRGLIHLPGTAVVTSRRDLPVTSTSWPVHDPSAATP